MKSSSNNCRARSDYRHLFLKVEEVIGLVDEEDLQSRAAQVVTPQVDLPDLREGPLEVVAHSLGNQNG